MAIDYVSLENRFYEILLKHLSERKYVNLEDNSPKIRLGFRGTHVNYSPDEPIWFFRGRRPNIKDMYFFGINDENDIKLALKLNKIRSKSFVVLFSSGEIAIKIKFTKEGAKIFKSLKKVFEIRNPSSKVVKYNYIIFNDEYEIIPGIANIIDILDFDYGKENLLIKGFKKHVDETYLDNLMESEKPSQMSGQEVSDESESDDLTEVSDEEPTEKDSDVSGQEVSDESESDDLTEVSDEEPTEKVSDFDVEKYISQSESYEFSVDTIISAIDCNAFEGDSSANEGLSQELKEYVKSPIFSFVSDGLDDDESSKLVICIEEDISDEKISGDVMDIVEFYFEQYKLIKKQFSLNNFLNSFIQSVDFARLLEAYAYGGEMVLAIINHVRRDISDDDSMDNDKVILKIEYYFKAEENKNEYFNQIDKIKADSLHYRLKYNLTKEEFDEILNYIQTKISEGYHIKNVENCLINKINEKVDLNRDKARLKLRKLLNNPEFIEKNNITQEQLNLISEHVGNLIYMNRIRSEEIDEKYLLLMRGI